MADCFGPLGGICAFLGAIGFLLDFSFLLGCLMFHSGMSDEKSDGLTSFGQSILIIGAIGTGLLILVLVLAFINQAMLPVGCH